MTLFRIDVSKETEAVTLWMVVPCGFKPIIGWAHLDGVREFAEMLLDFYDNRKEDKDEVKAVSGKLLQQTLDDEEYHKIFLINN